MRRAESVVQDALPDVAYVARAVLEEGTLDSVRHANDEFLGLVDRCHARSAGAAPVLGLGVENARRIAALAPAARAVASRCPYSLFNLRFEDASFWRAVVRDVERAPPLAVSPAASPAVPVAPEPEVAFTRTAVFLAWHLAQSSEFAAAIVLGMTPDVQATWRALPLPNVERAARLAAPQLRARWGAHARFWPKLLDAAEHPSAQQAERMRLLGLQLLAADGIRPQLAQHSRRGLRSGAAFESAAT